MPQNLLKLKLILAAFSFIIYSNSLFNGYSIDDSLVTALNPVVQKGVGGIYEIFTTNYVVDESGGYEYRPIVKASYALEYSIWGDNVFLSHLINLLLFAFLVVYAFKLIVNIFGAEYTTAAFVGMLLFAAHPIHTEVVNNLKSRDELLSFIFSAISLNLIVNYYRKGKLVYLAGGLLVFVIAMLSKLSALVFIPIILLTLYYIDSKKKINFTRIAVLGGVLIGIVALYALLASSLLQGFDRKIKYIENPFQYNGLAMQLSSAMNSLGWYIRLFFFPYPLRYYYGYNQIPIVGFGHPGALFSTLLHIALFGYAIFNVKKKSFFAYCIFFYLFAIFPFSNIIAIVPGIIGERFAFAASLGFCLAMGYALYLLADKWNVLKGKRLFNSAAAGAIAVSLLFILPYSYLTFKRNFDWKDKLTLISVDIKYLPKSAKANYMFGMENKLLANNAKTKNERAKYYEKAIKYFDKASKILPDYGLAYYNMGLIQHYYYNNIDYALALMRKANATDSLFIDAKYELGCLEGLKGNYQLTISLMNEVLPKRPKATDVRFELVKSYCATGKVAEAEVYLKEIEAIETNTYAYFMSKAFVHLVKNDTLQYLSNASLALDKMPENKTLAVFLSDFYKRHNDFNNADLFMRKAARADSINNMLK